MQVRVTPVVLHHFTVIVLEGKGPLQMLFGMLVSVHDGWLQVSMIVPPEAQFGFVTHRLSESHVVSSAFVQHLSGGMLLGVSWPTMRSASCARSRLSELTALVTSTATAMKQTHTAK